MWPVKGLHLRTTRRSSTVYMMAQISVDLLFLSQFYLKLLKKFHLCHLGYYLLRDFYLLLMTLA